MHAHLLRSLCKRGFLDVVDVWTPPHLLVNLKYEVWMHVWNAVAGVLLGLGCIVPTTEGEGGGATEDSQVGENTSRTTFAV